MLKHVIHTAIVGALFFGPSTTLAGSSEKAFADASATDGIAKSQTLSFRDIEKLQPIENSQVKAASFTTSQLIDGFKAQYGLSFEFKPHNVLKATQSKFAQVSTAKLSHQRFDQYYQGYPIWGHQIAVHTDQKGQVLKLNGQVVKSINHSLFVQGSNSSKYDKNQVTAKALELIKSYHADANVHIFDEQVRAYVYISKRGKAHLVYHLNSYYLVNNRPFAPNMLIDANNLEVLKTWDGIMNLDAHAKGPGGNEKIGRYVYGEDKPFLDVRADGNTCRLENEHVKTMHFYNTIFGDKAHEFTCSDNNEQAENGAYSPLNDAHYFATETAKMFNLWLNTPVASEQVNVRVHESVPYAYAFKNSIHIIKGDQWHFPNSTVNTVGHEMAHVFISKDVDFLKYGQIAAVNESFADITGEALEYFTNGEVDWLVDADVRKDAKPLRYFQKPSKDGQSIEHIEQYKSELETHQGAGIFNRAFYLLANSTGWDVQKAFIVFADAMRFYWVSNSSYEQAACGVIHAADDRGLNSGDVDSAFMAVGIECSNLPTTDNDNDGMANAWELRYGLDPANANDANGDIDGDQLSNVLEYQHQSSPINRDTDGDWFEDYEEVFFHNTKVNDWDTDFDGIEDGFEDINGGDPLADGRYADLDGDGYSDNIEVLYGTYGHDGRSRPDVIVRDIQTFDKENLGSGWHIDIGTAIDNRHLWQRKEQTNSQAEGDYFYRVNLSLADGETYLIWYENFSAGYVVFDYAYQGSDIDLELRASGQLTKGILQNSQPNQWHRHSVRVKEDLSSVRWLLSSKGEQGQFDIDNIHYFADGMDQDGDGVEDYWEYLHGLNFNDKSDGAIDSDGDGLSNAQESRLGTNPHLRDTDGDGYSDYAEVNLHKTDPLSADGDNDGMDDSWEVRFGLNTQANDANDDLDNDGITNIVEFNSGTEPNNAQSLPQGHESFIYDFESGLPSGFILDVEHFIYDDDIGEYIAVEVESEWQIEQREGGNHVLRAPNSDLSMPVGLKWQGYVQSGILVFDLNAQFNDLGLNHNLFSSLRIIVDDEVVEILTYDKVTTKSIQLTQGWHTIEFKYTNGTLKRTEQDDIYIDNFAFYASNLDSDADGITDATEHLLGLDRNDPTDAAIDSDDDGLTNIEEIGLGMEIFNADMDDDGLMDGAEVNTHKTSPFLKDTDFDSLPDGWEVTNGLDPLTSNYQVDSDGDGSYDTLEYVAGTDPQDASIYPLPLSTDVQQFTSAQMPAEFMGDTSELGTWQVVKDLDSDNYWLSATAQSGQSAVLNITGVSEYRYLILDYKTDMANGNSLSVHRDTLDSVADWKNQLIDLGFNRSKVTIEYTNRAGSQDVVYIDNMIFTDSQSADHDGDGIPSVWEARHGLKALDASDGALDADNDGLTNLEEYQNNTDILTADSDYDGVNDGDEIKVYGSNPNSSDTDNDGMSDAQEISLGFNPITNNKLTDTDNDGLTDEAEYYFETDHNDANSTITDFSYVHYNFNDGRIPRAFEFLFDTKGKLVADENNPNNKILTHTIEDYTFTNYWYFSLYSMYSHGTFFVDAKSSIVDELRVKPTWGYRESISATGNQWQRYSMKLEPQSEGLGAIEFYSQPLTNIITGSDAIRQLFWIDNITFIADGRDADNDGMDDSWEYGYKLNITADDGNIDADNDGMTNLEEFQNGTNPKLADTDGDGLSDYQEIFEYGSNATLYDSDDDGLSDKFEVENGTHLLYSNALLDHDDDGYSDLAEIQSGSDWKDSSSIPPSHNYLNFEFHHSNLPSELFLYGSGEDGENTHWYFGDGIGFENTGAIVYKPTSNNKEIDMVLAGHFEPGTLSFDWRESDKFGYSFEFTMVQNSDFRRAANGRWKNEVIEITEAGFYQFTWTVKSYSDIAHNEIVGYVDNIKYVSNELDTDGDGLPDHWEIAYGLRPDSSADGQGDFDVDGLNNLQEYQAGTNPTIVDTDGDTISDYDEVTTHNTSPVNLDSDGDGMFDHLEIFYGLDPNLAAVESDMDDDGVVNTLETYLFTNPISSSSSATTIDIAKVDFETEGSLIHMQNRVTEGNGWQLQTTDNNTYVEAMVEDYGATTNLLWLGKFGKGKLYFDYFLKAFDTDKFEVKYNGQTIMQKYDGNDWLRTGIAIEGADAAQAISWHYYRRESFYLPVLTGLKLDNIVFIADGSDKDADGMGDQWEYENGLDYNDFNDAFYDPDGDGLSNLQEYQAGTNINNADTDNDGYSDSYELENGLDPHDYRDGVKDSDGDGLSDEKERELGTDVNNPDTDGDGVNDKLDAFPLDPLESEDKDGNGLGDIYQNDYDYDGMSNAFESEYGLDLYSDDTQADLDNDGMTNWQEFYYQFEPNNPADANGDADKDGHTNLMEILSGTNPLDAKSYPGNVGSWFHILLNDG